MKAIRQKTKVRAKHRSGRSNVRPIHLAFLLQDWEDAYNVGGMFRVADGCGSRELIFSGRTPSPPHPQIGVTSLGQHRRIPFRSFESNEAAAIALKAEGYALVAIEIAPEAVHYAEFDYPEKVCLVLGNEEKGIYGSVMAHCDACVYIPMLGKGRSLNVHVSAAVVAFRAVFPGSQG
ncbi:MAG TPA: TrmH family RNA methyltransferase [Fimbriimonadaceae bacterium]|nr:TrmH family RNA methyltransferase [Fimbriimonadaceae bacterium]